MDLFGLPLTETLKTETKLMTALDILPQVGASCFFFKVWEAPYDKRGRTTVHNTGQRHNTGHRQRGNNTQGAKAQRTTREKESAPQWDAWAFSAAHGLLTTPTGVE